MVDNLLLSRQVAFLALNSRHIQDVNALSLLSDVFASNGRHHHHPIPVILSCKQNLKLILSSSHQASTHRLRSPMIQSATMYLHLLILLLLAHNMYLVHAVQIGRDLPGSLIDISAISLMTSRHIGYVDQRIRQDTYTSLNHEQWHHRNTLSPPIDSAETLSSTSSALVPPTTASTRAANASLHTASDTTTLKLASLKNRLHTTMALEADGREAWDKQTDTACSAALSALNGVVSNPSGVSACYNIHNFNSFNGAFQVDLRLYRIGAPTGDWAQTDGTDVNLELTYPEATVNAGGSLKDKREVVGITLPPIQKDDARAMYRMRSNGSTPKKFDHLTFRGQIDGDFRAEIMHE